MSDHGTDEAAESGALDESTEPEGEGAATDEPGESGGLLEEQEHKGYGADEGEREQSL
jgi:hypothetical protein